MSRAYTEEEVREKLLGHLKVLAKSWENTGKDTADCLDGFIHSTLCVFDGVSGDIPALDIVVRPHPDDKKFCQDQDENYFEDGMVINDCMLNEIYGQGKKKE